jgi:hypothetical protein
MYKHGESFSDYQQRTELNASLLKHAFKSWKQFKWVRERGFKPKADTRLGTALHSFVELLPVEKFQDVFVVMPDFPKSPENVDAKGKPSTSSNTKWVREQKAAFYADNDEGMILERSQYDRAVRMLESIQANGHAMELIENAQKEVTVSAEINGVACKGRLDGLTLNGFWDVKTSRDIAPHRFGRTAADLGYLFQLAFYWRLLAANGMEAERVDIIAVQDPIARDDGRWNEAPDCCVYSVSMVAIENQFLRIDKLLEEYSECERTNVWPGCPDGELDVPLWSMTEEELVD